MLHSPYNGSTIQQMMSFRLFAAALRAPISLRWSRLELDLRLQSWDILNTYNGNDEPDEWRRRTDIISVAPWRSADRTYIASHARVDIEQE